MLAALAAMSSSNGCASCLRAMKAVGEVTRAVSEVDQAERQRALEHKVGLLEEEQRVRAELARVRERADALERAQAMRGDAREERRAEETRDRASAPPVLAVFDVETTEGLGAETARALTELVYLELAAAGQCQLVPLERAREALVAAQQESFSPCVDDACRLELGKALAAQKVVRPVLLPDAHGCIFALDVYDLTRETRDWARTLRTGCDAEGLSAAAHTLARAMPRL